MNGNDEVYSDSHNGFEPESWVDNYGDALYGFALMRVRNEEVAQEMVQETFLAALKAKDRFQGRSSEKTWLISILKNKIFDYFGRVSRERAFNSTNSAAEPANDFFDGSGNWINGPVRWPEDPHRWLEQKEFFEVFRSCLSKLPPRLAQAFILREVEGLEGKKICEIMDITANNLWVMLYRARMHLRSHLEKVWLNEHGQEEPGVGAEDA